MSSATVKAPATRVQNPNAYAVRVAFDPLRPTEKPQEFYEEIKQKFAEARDLRAERDSLQAQLDVLKNKTRRLSDGFLDLDLLGEQTRDVLGYMRPDEVVIR